MRDKPRKITATLKVVVTGEFYEDEASEETLRYYVQQNLEDVIFDADVELLKEQEAITIKKTKEHGFGVYGGICPKCRNWIQSAHSYCGFCGQAVKWE